MGLRRVWRGLVEQLQGSLRQSSVRPRRSHLLLEALEEWVEAGKSADGYVKDVVRSGADPNLFRYSPLPH